MRNEIEGFEYVPQNKMQRILANYASFCGLEMHRISASLSPA